MFQFVQPLESRRLLSATVTLPVAEAKLASDVKSIVADAKSSAKSVIAEAKAFDAAVVALHLPKGALRTKLLADVAAARATVTADVNHLLSSEYKNGEAVVGDVLHIYFFDAGNPAAIAKDQIHLSADLKKFRAGATPQLNKLTADVAKYEAKLSADVGAVIAAYPSDTVLQTSFAALSSGIQSAQQTLTGDYNTISADLDALSTAT